MSIQTEINRLNTAKTDILNSIKNKGVDTSSAETLSDVSSLIDNITTKEDLSNELNTYESYLSTQETTIDDILIAIQNKKEGSGATEIDSIITRTITSFTNDRIISIGASALRNSKITSINCPNVTTLEANALDTCTSLVDVQLQNVTTLKNYAMQKCTAVVRLDFQQKISCQGSVWYNCSSLTTLILRGSTMSGLGNKNCFNGTPIASGTGYIYVPDNLVASYKSASNWSTYASQIKGLSELEV